MAMAILEAFGRNRQKVVIFHPIFHWGLTFYKNSFGVARVT